MARKKSKRKRKQARKLTPPLFLKTESGERLVVEVDQERAVTGERMEASGRFVGFLKFGRGLALTVGSRCLNKKRLPVVSIDIAERDEVPAPPERPALGQALRHVRDAMKKSAEVKLHILAYDTEANGTGCDTFLRHKAALARQIELSTSDEEKRKELTTLLEAAPWGSTEARQFQDALDDARDPMDTFHLQTVTLKIPTVDTLRYALVDLIEKHQEGMLTEAEWSNAVRAVGPVTLAVGLVSGN